MKNEQGPQYPITKEQAIALGKSRFWEQMTHRQIAEFQINARLMCVPLSVFHEAVEKTLGRWVFTHEFGLNYDGIRAELLNGAPPPTFERIVALIPEEKRILVTANTSR